LPLLVNYSQCHIIAHSISPICPIGSVNEAVDYFALQVPAISYSAVRASRLQWQQQRRLYSQKEAQGGYKTHFYTVASHNNTELQNLEFSARFAGVDLVVLGVGREYTSWLQKLEWYAEALLDPRENAVRDHDLLVLMDAYDVLLTPLVRQLGARLSRAATPLLACAENGQYPEPEAPWLYPRGDSSAFAPSPMTTYPSDTAAGPEEGGRRVGGATRFLNSGCLAGRGKDVKDFLREIFHEMKLVRDDQQVFVRHFLRNPHVLSIDSETHTDREQHHQQQSAVFQCGWRVPLDAFTELSYTGVARLYGAFLPVGLFHMNNRQSEPLYQALVNMYRRLYAACFAGPTGARLLRALHLRVDGEKEAALRVLAEAHPEREGLSAAELACSDSIRGGEGLPESEVIDAAGRWADWGV
jgi:hypothetical protein